MNDVLQNALESVKVYFPNGLAYNVFDYDPAHKELWLGGAFCAAIENQGVEAVRVLSVQINLKFDEGCES